MSSRTSGDFTVAGDVIVERGVAARHRLQPVVEIEHDLVERQLVGDEHAIRRQVLEPLLHAALVLAQLQDPADVLRRRQDHRGDHRLFDRLDARRIRHLRRAVDLVHLAVGGRHPVQHARRRRHQVHVELALEPLLDDLHVEQAEEAAAEPEPERRRRLGLVEQRRVVEPQLLERLAQLRVLVALDRDTARRTPSACSSLKPGNGSRAGRAASVTVSPIFASPTFLIPATMKPTSPARELRRPPAASARNTPTCSTS